MPMPEYDDLQRTVNNAKSNIDCALRSDPTCILKTREAMYQSIVLALQVLERIPPLPLPPYAEGPKNGKRKRKKRKRKKKSAKKKSRK